MAYHHNRSLRASLLAVLYLLLFPVTDALSADKEAKIVVLAHRGVPKAIEMWTPTAEYLSENIPGYYFTISPVSNDSIESAMSSGEANFVLLNPALYAQMEMEYGVSRIATLRNRRPGGSYTNFGALIITRADNKEINTLQDLRGKSFMAVHPRAFGGWWMAWHKLKKTGIDPHEDFSRLEYSGFPQDKIVLAVKNGLIDAGTVRTDVLERMAASGVVSLNEFRVLDPQTSPGFPFAHSTQLYPEWPFAITRSTPPGLAEKVAIALLSIKPDSPAAIASKSEGWTVPLDYQPVHELMKELQVGPHEKDGEIPVREILNQYFLETLIIVIFFIGLIVSVTVFIKLNRKLSLSRESLLKEVNDRKKAELAEHEQVERIRTLYEVSSMPGLNLEQQIDEILKLGCQTLGMEVGKVSLINREHHTNTMINAVVPGSLEIRPGNTWNLDGTFCSLLDADELDMLALNHISQSEYHDHTAYITSGIESYIGIPILVKEDKYWTISFASPTPREPFPDADTDLVKLMGRWVSVILERENVEEELQQAKESSETANRAKSDFLANISHELRTPLNAIIGYSLLLKEEVVADDQRKYLKDIEKVHDSGTQLLTLINSILDISKIEADKMDLYIDPIDLGLLLNDIASTMQTSIRENNNKLTIIDTDELDIFETDVAKLRQTIINLVDNANKFTHDGEITIDAEIEYNGEKKFARINVRDTGIGIAAENIDNLFNDFSQVDQSRTRKYDGTGLGLAISQRFCKLLGGEITVKSEPNVGSTFTIYLPSAANQDEEGINILP